MAAGELVGIIAAAGTGERLGVGRPKAFVTCAGRPLVEWSVAPVTAVCDRVVVALPAAAGEVCGALSAVEIVEGGRSRSESVAAAVRAAPDAEAYLVHDAARPLVTRELVERCVAEVAGGWDAAVAAAPVTDTVKEVASDGAVLRTLERSSLWAVQTPQAFRGEALRRALDVGPDRLAAATDDAALVEEAGGRVRVVRAPAENVKVTSQADLATAEALLANRGETAC